MKAAVILAAGDGTKVVPYQQTRQKAALPVCNVPLIRRLADDLRSLGIERLVVVIGHLGQQVRHALGGLEGVVFVEQAQRGGTAQAALQALDRLDREDGAFLLAYGDIACARENIAKLLDDFKASGAEAAALVQPLGDERALDWLCASVSGQRLDGVSGHVRSASHRLCGVYALRRSAGDYLQRNPGIFRHVSVGGMPPIESEVAESVQLMIEEGKEILAVPTVDFFVDVDKPWHILDANRRAADYIFRNLEADRIHPSARISKKAELGGRVVIGENSVIGDGVQTEGPIWIGRDTSITRGATVGGSTVIGDDCRLFQYCEVGGGSVIGDHCRIGHGAEFSGVMFDRVCAYHYCEIAGVVGSAADIGAATVCGTLRFDDEKQVIRIKDRPERPARGGSCAYIGDYCRTGVGAILMPGCRVGPYSLVGPGVVVYDEVPANTMVLLKQELVEKPWGPEKYGW